MTEPLGLEVIWYEATDLQCMNYMLGVGLGRYLYLAEMNRALQQKPRRLILTEQDKTQRRADKNVLLRENESKRS